MQQQYRRGVSKNQNSTTVIVYWQCQIQCGSIQQQYVMHYARCMVYIQWWYTQNQPQCIMFGGPEEFKGGQINMFYHRFQGQGGEGWAVQCSIAPFSYYVLFIARCAPNSRKKWLRRVLWVRFPTAPAFYSICIVTQFILYKKF